MYSVGSVFLLPFFNVFYRSVMLPQRWRALQPAAARPLLLNQLADSGANCTQASAGTWASAKS